MGEFLALSDFPDQMLVFENYVFSGSKSRYEVNGNSTIFTLEIRLNLLSEGDCTCNAG